jgi:DNA processing protein
MPDMDATDRALALARAPSLHAGHLSEHRELLTDPGTLVGMSRRDLLALELSDATASWLADPDAALVASDRAWLESDSVRLLRHGQSGYPPLLATIDDAPLVLFVRGRIETLSQPLLAMVGSRKASASGRRIASQFAAELAGLGVGICSGLALGIDAASHQGALQAGLTVAVTGTGLDGVYPPEHRQLAERIAAAGALVSEFPPGTPPLRDHFPRRNRLISGLSVGTLVVEAARRSGSLITARLAADQGRTVFALPGSIHHSLSEGCHALIRNGALLVTSVEDVLNDLQLSHLKQWLNPCCTQATAGAACAPRLDKDYEILLDVLGFEPAGIDALVGRTGLSSQSLASMLLILELSGQVALHDGGRYMRLTSTTEHHGKHSF